MSDPKVTSIRYAASVTAPVSVEEAQSQKTRLEETLPEITQAREWVEEYGDMNDLAELEILEGKIKSTLALLDHFLLTGEWSAPAGAGDGGVNSNDGYSNWAGTLEAGWNGENITARPEIPGGYPGLDTLVPDGEFQGFVFFQSDIAFQAHGDAIKLEGRLNGKDLIQIETYKDENGNEKQRFWIVKDYVTQVEYDVLFSAHNLDHGIEMDYSKTYRISEDPYNKTEEEAIGWTAFVGTDHEDIIRGAQNRNMIAGLKGNDTLTGGGSTDTIYGDDWDGMERGSLGLRTDLADGDDLLDGGAGEDILEGGAGLNSGIKGDVANATNVQIPIDPINVTPPQNSWLIGGLEGTTGWEFSEEIEPGVVEIKETGLEENSRLVLQIPPGYEMAFAEPMPDQSLKVTFISGAKTFTVIIKDALAPRINSLNSPFTLEIRGNDQSNIIDFHRVDFGNNIFVAKGMGGSDMIMEPSNTLLKDGLRFADLTDHRYGATDRKLEEFRSNNIKIVGFTEVEGVEKPVEATLENSEIVLRRKVAGNDAKQMRLDPADYEHAYVYEDPDSNPPELVVVLVKKGVDGATRPETLTVRFKDWHQFQAQDKRGTKDLSWLFVSKTAPAAQPGGAAPGAVPDIPIIPLTLAVLPGHGVLNGNIIFGGEGQDSAFVTSHDFTSEIEDKISLDLADTPPPPPDEE